MSNTDESPIHCHYLAHGGAAGVLGTPTSDEEEVTGRGAIPGRRRHFQGTFYGTEHGRQHSVSLRPSVHKVPASCDSPDEIGTPISSTIVWSAETGAHAVHGEIRSLWLDREAESGDLGYPISDEIPTPDGRGRRSKFQFGEIWWYPESGAEQKRTY